MKSVPGTVSTTSVAAPSVTLIESGAGLASVPLLANVTVNVSTTVSANVIVATPPETVTVSAPPL